MKLLIISDGHGNVERLDQIAPVAQAADAVLYGGDFAECFRTETGRPFLERLVKLNDRTFAVSGNCDEPEFRETLEEYDISIEGSLSYFGGLMLAGSGGGSKFTGKTPNERDDEELVGDLRLVMERSSGDGIETVAEDGTGSASGAAGAAGKGGEDSTWDNLVVIMHNPPKDTACDLVAPGVHVGSTLLREFIETCRPLLVVCGHIHESAGIERLGRSVVVNPGALAEGKYAVAELSGGGKAPFAVSKIELKQLD